MNDGSDPKHIATCSAIPITHNEYRKILSTANKLETIQNKLDSVIDLFATPIVTNLFSKLCSDCVHLLTKCDFKLEEFRKAEELVWRRAYHDVYRLLKTKRQAIRKQDECLVESHFMTGIGFYSTLIVQLRVKYRIIQHVHGVIMPLNLALASVEGLLDGQWLGPGHEADATTITEPELVQQWARQAIYRSLIYMGDLARYLLEFSEHDHRKLAFELYRSASRYQPDYGLPYNQLAALAGNLNYNLDAVCNYMRCCLRPKPFERAEGNMIKMFEMNRKNYDELMEDGFQVIRASDVLASKDPVREAEHLMKSAIVTFLKLASDLWFATGENLGRDLHTSVVPEFQKFFEILREAMELDPIVPFASSSSLDMDFKPISGQTSDPERSRYVSPTIIYEFCSISLMLVARRHQKSAPKVSSLFSPDLDDNISELVNTLALNLLHYTTSKCQRMVISKIQDIRLLRQHDSSIVDSKSGGLVKPSSEMSLRNTVSPISSDAASRRVMSRLRQKKAASTYTSGQSANKSILNRAIIRPPMRNIDDSDLSELEETALSTIDALDISSDMSGDDGPNDLINLDSSSGTSDDAGQGERSKISIRRSLLSRPALRPTKSQTYEIDKKSNFHIPPDSCNSLPMPDLLTGDLVDISFRTNPTIYHDTSGTPSELGSEPRISSSASLIESTLAYIYNQTYLPTIKVFFDWLLSNGAIIDSNLESFSGFQAELQKIVELLDEIKLLIELTDSGESEIYDHSFCGPEWTQKYPLSCDYAFVNLSPIQDVHESNIDFEYERELDEPESGFITIQCILAFSYALSIFLRNKINSKN